MPPAEIEIPDGSLDAVLVFSLDMRAEQMQFLRDEPEALAQILGLERRKQSLDMAHAEIFDIADLEDLGLLGYLSEGLGIDEACLSDNGLILDNLRGPVLLLRARAFDGQGAILTPAKQLTLVAHLGERKTNWTSPPLTHPPTPQLQSPRAARHRARRIGAALFAVVMTLIFVLVWILAT